MSEMDFPSGPWTGFYNYGANARKHRMDLYLSFAAGKISGGGIEKRWQFVVAGRYDPGSHECYWTKSYIGAHDVYYRGFREGKGIWGIWALPLGSGGFHIWPLSQGDGERQAATIEEPEPVELVAAIAKRSITADDQLPVLADSHSSTTSVMRKN